MKRLTLLVTFFFLGFIPSLIGQNFNKKFVLPTNWFHLVQTDNSGNIYVAGLHRNYGIIILKLDSAGNEIWGKEIGYMSFYLNDFLITDNQKLILLADNPNYSKTSIICLDTAGNFLYDKEIGDGLSQDNYDGSIVQDSMGYSLCLNYVDPVKSGFKMMKFDYNGNILYERIVIASSVGHITIIKQPNGGYIVFDNGYCILLRTDNDFNNAAYVIPRHFFNFSVFYARSMVCISDNEFYIAGQTDQGRAFVGKLNENLIMNSVKCYEPDSTAGFLEIRDIHQLPDKSWMLLFYREPYLGIDSNTFLVCHTDSLFNPIKTASINSNYYMEPGDNFIIRSGVLNNTSISFCSSNGYPSSGIGTEVSVIRVDTSLSGICETSFANQNIILDGSPDTIQYTFRTDTITSIINSVTVSVVNFSPPSFLCNDSCYAAFNIYADTIPHNWLVLNQSSGIAPLSYQWKWGDGDSSVGSSPSHIYSTPGYYSICLTIGDSSGCSSTYCDSSTFLSRPSTSGTMITVNVINNIVTTSGELFEEKVPLNIYPVPTSGKITIENKAKNYFEIYDISGKLLMKNVIANSKFEIDLTNLNSGIYFLTVGDSEKQVHQKIIKE